MLAGVGCAHRPLGVQVIRERDINRIDVRICEQLLIGASTHSGQPGPCDELGTALRLASDRDELDPVGAQNRRDHDLARDIRSAEDSHAQGGHGPERTLGGMAVLLGGRGNRNHLQRGPEPANGARRLYDVDPEARRRHLSRPYAARTSQRPPRNCLRTLPHLRAWYAAYHKDGFEIVGVHTPEFAFEHVLGNVRQATHDLRVSPGVTAYAFTFG